MEPFPLTEVARLMSILIPFTILGTLAIGAVRMATPELADADLLNEDHSQAPESAEAPAPAECDDDWQSRYFDSLQEVEAWLDHLESAGVADRDLHLQNDGQFLVRWR